jgi:hypothetical protein
MWGEGQVHRVLIAGPPAPGSVGSHCGTPASAQWVRPGPGARARGAASQTGGPKPSPASLPDKLAANARVSHSAWQTAT